MAKRRKPKQPKPHLKRLEDMNEPELAEHFSSIMESVDDRQPDDVIGSLVVTFMGNGISQYDTTNKIAANLVVVGGVDFEQRSGIGSGNGGQMSFHVG